MSVIKSTRIVRPAAIIGEVTASIRVFDDDDVMAMLTEYEVIEGGAAPGL